MNNIKKLDINDSTGAFKNVNDLLEELRNRNIEALTYFGKVKNMLKQRNFVGEKV